MFLFLVLTSVQGINAQDTSGVKRPEEKISRRQLRKQERQDQLRELVRREEEGALIFNKQNVFAFRLNTDGWGIAYERGKLKSVKLTQLFTLDFSEKRHPKEERLSYQFATGNFIQIGSPYVYGKKNIFYQLKAGFGQQRLIGGKTNRNGVAIHWIYAGGPSIGLERPYYVKVFNNGQGIVEDIRYTQEDSSIFLAPGNIAQGTGLRYGWNQLRLIPGLHLRTSLRFDYGRYNELVSGLEIGINAEFYTRAPEIMLLNKNRAFFFNSYIALLLGKRK